MSERSVSHGDFVIERVYDAPIRRVFSAWQKPEKKRRWFACHDEWVVTHYELDFRIGGIERSRTGPAGGTVHAFDARYHDIVDDLRIVYSYEMRLDAALISVSLVTVQFEGQGARTAMSFTEQVVVLDGLASIADREHGTRIGLDALGEYLTREATEA
ncbi:MAG: ATPase [Polyangiaceae bacterium]|nr:ATPase [Polyangiaceae bacterium]